MNSSAGNSDAANPLEDVHVEIEHVQPEEDEDDDEDGDTDGEIANDVDGSGGQQGLVPVVSGNSALPRPPPQLLQQQHQKVQLYTRVQGKRTVILPYQRKILEEFYNTGMVSASHNLHHLHEAAADQTGLELYVIKNWVRNRRRPSAAQKRQEIQEVSAHLASSSPLIQSPLTTLSNIPFSTNITTVTLPTQNHTHHTPPILTIPEPKRVCFDNATSILTNDSGSNSLKLFTIKVRIADSGETDFVEVDVHTHSYIDLVRSICEELEISPDDVSKIRKLPNVLIRKDRDVGRLENGQELELVLKGGGGGSNHSIQQTLMTLNPFSGNSSVQLIPLMNTAESNTLLSLDHTGQVSDGGGSNHS